MTDPQPSWRLLADRLSAEGRHLTRLSSLICPAVLGSSRGSQEKLPWDMVRRVTGRLWWPWMVGADRTALGQRGKTLRAELGELLMRFP